MPKEDDILHWRNLRLEGPREGWRKKGRATVNTAKTELTAEDYAYLLPDHWVLHDREPEEIFTRLHSYYVQRVANIIKASGARTVLEVGCGDGWASGKMAESGLDVVGIDWSSNAIGYASMLVRGARFFAGDVRDSEFLRRFPNKFDAIALIEVIEHIPPKDCVAALQGISTVLKPGGTFVLTTPSTNLPNTSTLHYRHFTPQVLRDLVASVGGLEVIALEGYGDMEAEKSFYRWSRWVDNRYYRIKPLRAMLLDKYNQRTKLDQTPFDRCHGLIMIMQRSSI
jgi:2-polyprenyl-3-methyl-5-hydroxy-6-metoxy-1,4-benzoquinol methylase